MSRRNVALVAIAIVVAAVCVRLGVWQLQRLGERRAWNDAVLAAFERPAVPLDSLAGAPEALRYRRVLVTGRYDRAAEMVVANRPRRGSPGVHVVTPLFHRQADTAVLVVRGWVYAPDAAHAELDRWREDSADAAVGYVQQYDAEIPGQRGSLRGRILSRLTWREATAAVSYPLAPYLVILTEGRDTVAGAPPRLESPVLGEGSHLSYAFQWFAFAAVALAGTFVFLRHSRPGSARHDRFEPR
jgi:surfeit locus 1 family protein